MTAKLPRRLALTTGVLFIAAGAFKLLLAAQGGSTPATDSAFAELLKQLGVPFPGFFAVAVPLVEVIGGSGLALNFAPRLWAAALTGDMAAAIFLVGAPGRRIQVGEYSAGGEAWRLPLELFLLGALLWILVFPPRRREA